MTKLYELAGDGFQIRPLIPLLLFFLSIISELTSADVVEETFAFGHEEIAALNPAPGTVITKDNVESFSHILAPKLVDLISDEFLTITTGEAISMSTHPAYIEATRRYLDQTELGDARGLFTITWRDGRSPGAAAR